MAAGEETSTQRRVDLRPGAQCRRVAVGGDGSNHELLEGLVGVGVRPAVEDVEVRHGQPAGHAGRTQRHPERGAGERGDEPGGRHGDAHDGVGAQPAPMRSPVEVDERVVHVGEARPVPPAEMMLDLAAHHRDRPQDALAIAPRLVTVTATHDRAFLVASADAIIELERGRARVFAGGCSEYLWRKAEETPPSGKQARRAHRRLLAELTLARADAHAGKRPRGTGSGTTSGAPSSRGTADLHRRDRALTRTSARRAGRRRRTPGHPGGARQRWAAWPGQPRPRPRSWREPAAARRAQQRPRPDDGALPRGRARRLPGLRRDRIPRQWFLDRLATHVLAWEGTSVRAPGPGSRGLPAPTTPIAVRRRSRPVHTPPVPALTTRLGVPGRP